MPLYHQAFQVGERVQIVEEATLRAFQEGWKPYIHAPSDEQIAYAGKTCFIRRIGYYHGGDCLYELLQYVLDANQPPDVRFPRSHEEALPGRWHEECLREKHYDEWDAQLPPACDIYKVTAEVRQGQPLVVVQTHTGIECLTKRCLENEREALLMNQVASLRNALAFERRYDFHGVMEDASRAHYAKKRKT